MAAADYGPRTQRKQTPPRESAAERLARAQELVRQLPHPPMSVDEFIAEKRREAQRER